MFGKGCQKGFRYVPSPNPVSSFQSGLPCGSQVTATPSVCILLAARPVEERCPGNSAPGIPWPGLTFLLLRSKCNALANFKLFLSGESNGKGRCPPSKR